jgi:hypothetical protein
MLSRRQIRRQSLHVCNDSIAKEKELPHECTRGTNTTFEAEYFQAKATQIRSCASHKLNLCAYSGHSPDIYVKVFIPFCETCPRDALGLLRRSSADGCHLGLRGRRSGFRLGLGHFFAPGGQDGVEDSAFHARHEFDDSSAANVQDQAVNDFVAKLAVGHLAAAKAQAGLHLVTFGEEADGLILFGLVIMLVDGDGKFDFLDDDDLLALACGAFALFLLVEKAAVILDSANGRDGGGGDFNEVETALARDFECLKGLENSQLFAVFVYDADFARANPIVDADEGLSSTFIECDGTPPKACLAGRGRAPMGRSEATQTEYSIGAASLKKAARGREGKNYPPVKPISEPSG